jgi:Protein of unknown function (DUF3102)
MKQQPPNYIRSSVTKAAPASNVAVVPAPGNRLTLVAARSAETDPVDVNLDVVAEQIRGARDLAVEGVRTAVTEAIHCGRLLTEAKEKVPRGEWVAWVNTKTGIDIRTAQKWDAPGRRRSPSANAGSVWNRGGP